MVDLTKNLMNELHHECERRESTIYCASEVLKKYSVSLAIRRLSIEGLSYATTILRARLAMLF